MLIPREELSQEVNQNFIEKQSEIATAINSNQQPGEREERLNVAITRMKLTTQSVQTVQANQPTIPPTSSADNPAKPKPASLPPQRPVIGVHVAALKQKRTSSQSVKPGINI